MTEVLLPFLINFLIKEGRDDLLFLNGKNFSLGYVLVKRCGRVLKILHTSTIYLPISQVLLTIFLKDSPDLNFSTLYERIRNIKIVGVKLFFEDDNIFVFSLNVITITMCLTLRLKNERLGIVCFLCILPCSDVV